MVFEITYSGDISFIHCYKFAAGTPNLSPICSVKHNETSKLVGLSY